MELVSIIIAVYNGVKTIEKSIQSAQCQTYENTEIIVVDDGSTDETFSTVKRIADQDVRIKLVHQKNSGVSAARNKGIEEAKGRYICFLDADDTYTDQYVARMVQTIEINSSELVVCGYVEGEKEWRYNSPGLHKGSGLGKDVFKFGKDQRLFNPCWNKLFLRDIIEQNSIRFPEGLAMGEDAEFVLKYIISISTFFILNDLLYVYSISETSVTSKPFKLDWAFYQEARYFLWDEYFEKMNLDRMELNYYIVTQMLLIAARIAGSNPIAPAMKVCKKIFYRPRMQQAAKELKNTKKDFTISKIVRGNHEIAYIALCISIGVLRKLKRKVKMG